jgi:hypothetical protein
MRRRIICGLESQSRINFGDFRLEAEQCADALDAGIAVFAVIATYYGRVTYPIAVNSLREGWIAIHP